MEDKMKFWKLTVQYHRMPKWIGKHLTKAPSHLRFFWAGQFLFDVPMPKYGRE